MWHGSLGEGNCSYNTIIAIVTPKIIIVCILLHHWLRMSFRFLRTTHITSFCYTICYTLKGKLTNWLWLITGKKHQHLCVYLEQFDTSMVGPSQFLPPHRGAGLSQDLERHRHELTPSTPSLLLQGCQGAHGPKPPLVVWFRSWQRVDIDRLIGGKGYVSGGREWGRGRGQRWWEVKV